ncbi:MAG TPA: hypothetical protein DDZ51_25245 [Planctomycetaceae bacterium]|nr:hypothetical protein [Planctomycetaceae bacterium]
MDETILSVLEGNDELSRVVLVHRRGFGANAVVLRRESFSEAIGWFEQSSVEMSPDQVGQLKQALGTVPMSKVKPPRTSFGRRYESGSYAMSISLATQNAG